MSVVASDARQHGTKRFLEPEHLLKTLAIETEGCSKRARHGHAWETLGERNGEGGLLAYAVDLGGGPTLAALRALFPHMTDQAITDALAEFGDNVDAAIKHLNALNLSFDQPETDIKQSQGAVEHKSVEEKSQVGRQERWTDILVAEMSMAKDVEDAKARATSVLLDFQNDFQNASYQKGTLYTNSSRERGDVPANQELVKENMILKRAVGIQNARLQELVGKDGQVRELEAALRAANEKIHALEVQNYGLQVHLRRATELQSNSEKFSGNLPNPDVF
jgi:hypothetical protein